MDTTYTTPNYRTETCRRCKGTGEYKGYGLCYGCQGRGTVRIEDGIRPMTADERIAHDEYLTGLDAREARAAARKARLAARDS